MLILLISADSSCTDTNKSPGKEWLLVTLNDRLNMTIAVDWDVKPQNKTKNNFKNIWLIRNNYYVESEVLVFCMSEQIYIYLISRSYLLQPKAIILYL